MSEEGCPLYECRVKYKGLCFYDRARIKAHGAHVLVVNHALLLADLANGGGTLPEYNHLIIDEAHNLEDEATEALGFTVNRGMLMKLLDDLSLPADPSPSARETRDFLSLLRSSLVAEVSQAQSAGGQTGPRSRTNITRDLMVTVDDIIGKLRHDMERAREYSSELFATFITVLDNYSDEYNAYDLRQRITEQVRRHPTWGQAEIIWDNLAGRLRSVEEALGNLVGMLGEPEWDSMPRKASDLPSYTEMLLELRNHLNNVHKLRTDMGAAIANPDEGAVYWLEARVKGGDVALRCAPLHVGDLLDRYLFSAKRTVVLTSATLSTENDFTYICERLGLRYRRRATALFAI